MDEQERGLKYERLTGAILHAFYDVYNELGQGFLESVYQNAMAIVLSSNGYRVDQKFSVPVWFRGCNVGNFEGDLLVEGRVIVELKAARMIDPAHEAQLLNYLRATDVEVGLLLNFGPEPKFRRLAYDNTRKRRPDPSS